MQCSRYDGERGTVTAEFAVVLTGVLTVLALCVSAIVVIGQQVALTSLASSGARMLARGEDEGAVRAAVSAAQPGTSFARSSDGSFVCLRLERAARLGPSSIGAIALSARACALGADVVPGDPG